MEQIKKNETELESRFEQLSSSLEAKESDLEKVKSLLVEKLKELESSFVELNQDVDENVGAAQ